MNIFWLLGAGGLGAVGTFLIGSTSFLDLLRKLFAASRLAARKQESETQVASALVVKQALSLVDSLSTQVKDLRGENLSLEEQNRRETASLRERIRNLEARVGELETDLETLRGENTWLKAQLYDQQQHAAPGITRSRGTGNRGSITPIRSTPTPRQSPPRKTTRRPIPPPSAEPDEGA